MNRFGQRISFTLVALLLLVPVVAAENPSHPKHQESSVEKPKPALPANPQDLIREAINDQLKNTTRQEFSTWKEKDSKPKGTTVKQIVETPEGVLGRIILKDGRPLTPDELKDEDARVNRLLDPEQMRQKAKGQKADEDRTLKMLKAIPDAFNFTYAESTTAPNGDLLSHVKFTARPDFDPPTRECLVFEGMQGDMIVDVNQKQIVKIDGTLFRDVTIGWGIIGHLDKGGRFIVEQAEVYKDHWDQTHMVLNFTGKALIFKTIKIQEDSTAWDFAPVQGMDVKTALNFLKSKENSGTAEASR